MQGVSIPEMRGYVMGRNCNRSVRLQALDVKVKASREQHGYLHYRGLDVPDLTDLKIQM